MVLCCITCISYCVLTAPNDKSFVSGNSALLSAAPATAPMLSPAAWEPAVPGKRCVPAGRPSRQYSSGNACLQPVATKGLVWVPNCCSCWLLPLSFHESRPCSLNRPWDSACVPGHLYIRFSPAMWLSP